MAETCYSPKTPNEVKAILEEYLHTDTRLRLFYGDKETGRDYNEEHGTMGYVGRSNGIRPVIILLHNKNSPGGGAILDDCIVKITRDKTILWQHPEYHCASFWWWWNVPQQKAEVSRCNELVARFNSGKQAERYIDFITGKRNNK